MKQHFHDKTLTALASPSYLVRRLLHAFADHYEPLFAPADITYPQWTILMLLYGNMACTSADMARQMCHDAGAMTRLVDQLEKRGLLSRQRDTADRRVVNLVLRPTTAAEMKVPVDDMPARIAALLDERRRLERELSDAKKKLAMGGGGGGAGAAGDGARDVGGVKLVARAISGISPKELPSLIDEAKKQIGSGVIAIVAVSEEGRAGISVGVTSDLTSRFNAVDLVKKGAEALGGKGGGGRPDMAQAGGPDGSKADAALKAVEVAMAGG